MISVGIWFRGTWDPVAWQLEDALGRDWAKEFPEELQNTSAGANIDWAHLFCG